MQPSLGGSLAIRSNCLETPPGKAEKAKPTQQTQQLNIVQPSLGGSLAIRSNCLETHPCKAEKQSLLSKPIN